MRKYEINFTEEGSKQQELLFSFDEKGVKQNTTKEEIEMDLPELLSKLWVLLRKPLIAVKYRLYKFLQDLFLRISIPWFKVAIVLALGFVIFQQDMQFEFNFKSPLIIGDDEEETDGAYRQSALGTSISWDEAIGNPFAPASPEMLKEKQTKEYIKRYSKVAIAEMEKFGIPASIKMAQALIESRSGDSRLARQNNNHFGIKCFSKRCRKGHCTNATDDHHKDFFRKYDSAWESWRAHSKMLGGNRYKSLQSYGKDYKKWAVGLRKAGYATDKNYDKKLVAVINKYKLFELDN